MTMTIRSTETLNIMENPETEICSKRLRRRTCMQSCRGVVVSIVLILVTLDEVVGWPSIEFRTHKSIRSLNSYEAKPEPFVQFHQNTQYFLKVNRMTRKVEVTKDRMSNETFFSNIMTSNGWTLRNAQTCTNICISLTGTIYTEGGIKNRNVDCKLNIFEPTHGYDTFIRDQNSTHILALGIKPNGKQNYLAIADWIPKNAVEDNFRLTVREVAYDEALKATYQGFRRDFFDIEMRENLCQRIATSLDDFKNDLVECGKKHHGKICKRRVRQKCKSLYGYKNCVRIFNVPNCNDLKDRNESKICKRDKRRQCREKNTKTHPKEDLKKACSVFVRVQQKCLRSHPLEGNKQLHKKCDKVAYSQSGLGSHANKRPKKQPRG